MSEMPDCKYDCYYIIIKTLTTPNVVGSNYRQAGRRAAAGIVFTHELRD